MCTTEDACLLNSMLVKASITNMSYFYVYIGDRNYGIIPTWDSVIVQNKLTMEHQAGDLGTFSL